MKSSSVQWSRAVSFSPLASKCHCQLHVQAIQIALAFAESMVKLRLEGHVLVDFVTHAKGWPLAQEDVFEDAVHIRVHILVADKRTKRAKLLRNLGVERRHVAFDVAMLE